jgi:deazaflavin-dependent oxidoreductase (nitroreductase family)
MESGGKDGHIWEGVATLLLTTTGRRSGESRTTPLIYGRDGDRYLVVASRGGAPEHPGWYQNLAAHPEIQVQVMADRFKARAPHGDPRGEAGALEDDGCDLAGLRRIPGQDGARDPSRHHRARLRRVQRGAAAGRRRRPRLIYLSSQTRAIADDP